MRVRVLSRSHEIAVSRRCSSDGNAVVTKCYIKPCVESRLNLVLDNSFVETRRKNEYL